MARKRKIQSKQHRCVCGADIARFYGVHRATVTRNLHKYYYHTYHKGKKFVELGHEFLLSIEETNSFIDWAAKRSGSLGDAVRMARKKNRKITSIACVKLKAKAEDSSAKSRVSLWEATEEGPKVNGAYSPTDMAKIIGVAQAGMSVWASKWATDYLTEEEKTVPTSLAYRYGRRVHFTPRGVKSLCRYIVDNASFSKIAHSIEKKAPNWLK